MTEHKKEIAVQNNTTLPLPSGSVSIDPFIGKIIGHCEILEKINEGGTANIYKAFNTSFKLNRVIKVLKPTLSEDEEFYIRFIQEAQLTARLDHPNILRVFDTGEIDGYFYIEMEYIEGCSLRSYISKSAKLSERETLQIASQLVNALEYAHNIQVEAPSGETINGILHRDIKPENIMITLDNTVKLMDFGAAKPLNITSNTMQGMIVGTFHYMSPEQLSGENLDARSDFFSIGIVIYEMFTGRKPFAAEKLVALITMIKSCKYTPLRKVRPAISPLSEELVEALLQRKRDHRPSTTKDIRESINISLQAYEAWGAGKKVRVPFSLKRFFPTLSMFFSTIALVISVFLLFNGAAGGKGKNSIDPSLKKLAVNMLDRGRQAEAKRLWREAVSVYESVPSPKDGGVVNEYLESQIRRANICFTRFNQFTKARSILERLRINYSDPAIDAYLGKIYFRQALYNEALDRLESAINSQKGSVIKQGYEFKKGLNYDYANALDRQYTYVDSDPAILREAIRAWDYFCDFASCSSNSKDKDCLQAKKRLKELEKVNNRLKKESQTVTVQ